MDVINNFRCYVLECNFKAFAFSCPTAHSFLCRTGVSLVKIFIQSVVKETQAYDLNHSLETFCFVSYILTALKKKKKL